MQPIRHNDGEPLHFVAHPARFPGSGRLPGEDRALKPLALAVIAFAATAAAASPYDGVYKQVANAECALVGVDGGALEIREGIFYGVGAECRMTRPVNVVDMEATLYTMQCTGEGSNWTERAMLMKPARAADEDGPDGLIMVWDGYAFVYEGCPAEE